MAVKGALSALELEREARIRANKLRLEQIGLIQTVEQIASSQGEAARARRKPTARASTAARRAAGALPPGRVRRSERVAGIDAPNYNENAHLLSLADGEGGSRDRRLMRENVREEVYDVDHLDALGSHKLGWELFVDGCDASGNRVYDKVNGVTCHQCRQKTLGKRTCCSGCQSLQGVLCGDCLFMRYGENVDEVNTNPDWQCPLCRDICNCSFHRSKRGWAPTGTLYRHAIAEGYISVAHYLVLNNLSNAAKPVALERGLCPPELAEELKKEINEAEASHKGAVGAAEGVSLSAADQEQVAVLNQLMQPEADPLDEAPAAMRRITRSRAMAGEEVQMSTKQKKQRQGTITLITGSKRQERAADVAKGGSPMVRAERRGLRSSVQ